MTQRTGEFKKGHTVNGSLVFESEWFLVKSGTLFKSGSVRSRRLSLIFLKVPRRVFPLVLKIGGNNLALINF